MTNIDALAGLARARTHSTNTPGMCLQFVWEAYGSHPSIGAHAGQYPIALNGWLYATEQHPGDMNPPAGVPCYFGVSPTRTDSNKGAGDIVISLGGGLVFCTDGAGGGRTGIMTIAARAHQIQRPYLGWTNDFLGYQLVNIGAGATPTHAPAPAPAPAGGNPFGVGDVRGLQKIANLNGAGTAIDNSWGPRSAAGFTAFLSKNWGYSGNSALGPIMWSAIARWLRARWGYVGNDVPGPLMRAALARANAANFSQL